MIMSPEGVSSIFCALFRTEREAWNQILSRHLFSSLLHLQACPMISSSICFATLDIHQRAATLESSSRHACHQLLKVSIFMPARSLGMTFGADADDALRQQIHNDPRPPWRRIVTKHCLTTSLPTDDTSPIDDAFWRHIAWRRIAPSRRITYRRRIVTTHCLTMQCPLTTHYPLTTHCHDTLPDDALPPPPYLGDAMGRHILWRHIQTCFAGGNWSRVLEFPGVATCSHLCGIFWSDHLRPLTCNGVAASGCEWLRVAASGCVWLWVAASGCEWLRVAARCQKCMSGFLKKMGSQEKRCFSSLESVSCIWRICGTSCWPWIFKITWQTVCRPRLPYSPCDGLPKCLFLVLLINCNSLRAASYCALKTMTGLNSLKPCILSFMFEAVAKTCSKC